MTSAKLTFEVTEITGAPARPSLSITIRSGFWSKRGMQQSATPVVGSGGTGNEISMPGSRIGRATPGSTVKVSPNASVGATEINESACTRMPSKRSS